MLLTQGNSLDLRVKVSRVNNVNRSVILREIDSDCDCNEYAFRRIDVLTNESSGFPRTKEVLLMKFHKFQATSYPRR